MSLGITSMLLAAGGAIVAMLAAYMKGEFAGARKERLKQAEGRVKATEELLEMDREATAIERATADLADAEAREEAMKWAKQR